MEKLILNDGREVKLSRSGDFRGWDAADELILSSEIEQNKILVIDDSNGALTCGLPGVVASFSSSLINEKDIKESMALNSLNVDTITDVDNLPKDVDLVVLRLPKFMDLLEYYIQVIGEKYPGVKVIVGGMAKYMPITMVRLMEEYFDDVSTSLTKKKARLILGKAASNKENPTQYPKRYKLDDDLIIASYPGVFSADHLDIGTRFLAEHIPTGEHGTIMDLGCGSGVLGLRAKKLNPDADVVLADISYAAVNSARESFKINGFDGEFHVMDCLKGYPAESVDVILCNPPFHNGNRVATDIAIDMFKQSRKVLTKGGVLYIVANKHLGYHKKLRATYHNLKKVAENEKFFIYMVRKI